MNIGTLAFTVTLILRVSAYAPMYDDGKHTNGTACLGKPWQSCFVQIGSAACSDDFARYTTFVIPEDYALSYGLPQTIVCKDRFGSRDIRRSLDLAFVSEDPAEDQRRALDWGVRYIPVIVSVEPAAVIAAPPKKKAPVIVLVDEAEKKAWHYTVVRYKKYIKE